MDSRDADTEDRNFSPVDVINNDIRYNQKMNHFRQSSWDGF